MLLVPNNTPHGCVVVVWCYEALMQSSASFWYLTFVLPDTAAAQAFRNGFTDRDIIDFLVNVECLEGQFDTYGAFGHGFFNNLSMGGVYNVHDVRSEWHCLKRS
jgi:hypothetical protein